VRGSFGYRVGVTSKPRTGFALFVLFAVNFMNFFDRQIAGALSEPIRREYGLSDTTLGLVATAFTLVYAAAGVPLGRLTDKWLRAKIVAGGVALWSVFTAASGLAPSLGTFVLARMGVGIGEASCAPASQSLLVDLFPPERRARAMGVFMLGLPLGIFAAYVFAGAIAATHGFRVAFYGAAVPGIVLAVLALFLKEPPRGAHDGAAANASSAVQKPFKSVLRVRTVWWIILSGLLFNFHVYAVNVFQTPFLQRFHGLGIKEASQISGLSLGLTGVVGLLAGGALGDMLKKSRPNGRLTLAAWCMLLSAPATLLALLQPAGKSSSFALYMGLGSALTFTYYATVYTSLHDVVPPALRGTAVSIYFFAMYVLGGAFGATGLGALSDTLARRAASAAGVSLDDAAARAQGLHGAMFVMPVLLAACAITLFLAARSYARDAAAVQHGLRAPASIPPAPAPVLAGRPGA
jgi:MFS family permease